MEYLIDCLVWTIIICGFIGTIIYVFWALSHVYLGVTSVVSLTVMETVSGTRTK